MSTQRNFAKRRDLASDSMPLVLASARIHRRRGIGRLPTVGRRQHVARAYGADKDGEGDGRKDDRIPAANKHLALVLNMAFNDYNS